MKKVLLFIILLVACLAGESQMTYPNYQDINQGYLWRRGLFRSLGLPSGDSASFTDTRALKRAGSVFYDSVDNSTPAGLYVYNGAVWELVVSTGGGASGNADSLGHQLPAYYLNRANHTGTQAQSTVVGLVDSLGTKANKYTKITINGTTFDLNGDTSATITDDTKVPTTRAINNGLAITGGGNLSADRTIGVDTAALSQYYYRQGVLNTLLALKVDSVKASNDSLFYHKSGSSFYSGLRLTDVWKLGGNSFGATGIIGTNDNNEFHIKTNNTVRMIVGASSGSVRINTGSSIYGQLQVTGVIAAFEERLVSSTVSGNKRMTMGWNGSYLELAGQNHAGNTSENFWIQRSGGEILAGDLLDQGDYKIQGKGGLYWDMTGKTFKLVGLGTDNTGAQVLARDASGNIVYRDVSTITGSGDNWGSQAVEHDATLTGNGTAGTPLGVDVDAVLSGVGVIDWSDGEGTGDSLVVVNGDTVKIKSLELVAGTNVTITEAHTADKLKYTIDASGSSGANTALGNLAAVAINTALLPATDNSIALGSGSKTWSDLFLGNGGVIDFNNGDAQLIHGSNNLSLVGANLSADIAPESTVGGTGNVVGTTNTQPLSNKRWIPRVISTTSSATPTINTDVTDVYKLTAQAADITSFTTNLSGTPNDGEVLEIQITPTATRAITWGSSFVSSSVALPTSAPGTTTITIILQYYTTSSYGNNKWHCTNVY